MKTIALDTNIAIDILNGKEDIVSEYDNYYILYEIPLATNDKHFNNITGLALN